MAAVLKPEEEVLFLPSCASWREEGNCWLGNIHAWVFALKQESLWRHGAIELFGRSLGMKAKEEENELFRSRAQYFLADNKSGRQLSVEICGELIELWPTQRNGHSLTPLTLSSHVVERNIIGGTQKLVFRATMPESDSRCFMGELFLLPDEGISVVSDIDDSIKISCVEDRQELLANTFLRDFEAVPGMAQLYQAWAAQGASFHYASASPWQLYPALHEFFEHNGFPQGTFFLKSFRWKDRSFFNLFKSSINIKRTAIEELLSLFPKREFILVGDCGEKDPELYAELAGAYPQQVKRIFLRRLSDDKSEQKRLDKVFAAVTKNVCQVFSDASEVSPDL